MSSGNKTESKTTTDPAQLAMLQRNYGVAQGTADKLGQSYTGQIVADPNQTQLNSRDAFRSIYNDNVGAAPLNSAIESTRGFLDFKPDVGQLSATDLAPYLNPYTQNVIDTTGRDLERQRGMAGVNDNRLATAAGAFGGSRQGVNDSLTNEAYDRNAGTLFAGLRQSGFQNAQDQARADLDRRLSGSVSGAGIRMNAGTNLANYSNMQLDQAGKRAGFMSAAGDAEQAQRQAELTAQYSEFIRMLTGTASGQQLLNQSLGIFPNQSSTSGSTKTDMTGQLIGAGLSALAMSDRRLKKNIERVGKTPGGLNVYSYEYIWNDKPQVGVMADEVEQVIPSAVIVGPMGFKMVDYSQVI